jgi:hypothetical protein
VANPPEISSKPSGEGSYQPVALLRALVDGGVDFVIVGGVAVVLQGLPRFTRDLDISYSQQADNLDRLGAVLVGVRARLRGIEELPFVPDGRTRASRPLTPLPAHARASTASSATRRASRSAS